MPFRLLDHDAEIGLELEAADEAGLLAEAARGLTACATDPATVRPVETRTVTVQGDTPEERLMLWLREWVYALDVDGFLPCSASVRIDPAGRVHGEVAGECRDPGRHPGLREIKAVTRHQLVSEPRADGWIGRVIFDV